MMLSGGACGEPRAGRSLINVSISLAPVHTVRCLTAARNLLARSAVETTMQSAVFEIEVDDAGAVVVLRLRGELDLAQVPAVESALERHARGRPALVVDLRELEFMDSSGLRILLGLRQTARVSRVAFHGPGFSRAPRLPAPRSRDGHGRPRHTRRRRRRRPEANRTSWRVGPKNACQASRHAPMDDVLVLQIVQSVRAVARAVAVRGV